MGDFNIDILKYDSHSESTDFVDLMYTSFLLPYIVAPTRVTPRSSTLIDNIFSNNIDDGSISGNLITTISDHFAQFLLLRDLKNSEQKTKTDQYKQDFSKLNKEHFEKDLKNTNWNSILETGKKDIDKSFESFLTTVNSIISDHAPLTKLSNKEKKLKNKPWVTKGILKSIAQKDKIRRKQCRAKNQALRESLKAKFKTYRNTINNLIRRSKANHYNNFFKSNKQNLIKTWQGIKEIIHSKPKIKDQIPSIRVNGKLCTNETLIANTFNKFFCDIPKKIENKLVETDIHFSNYLKNPGKKSFFLRPTTEGEVESQLKTLKNNKATGPYSIPTKLLKLFPKLISRPLSMLINLSFSVGKFPTILKLGQILPFHKRDDKSNCNNYRPISLISNLSKIIEKIFQTIFILRTGRTTLQQTIWFLQ